MDFAANLKEVLRFYIWTNENFYGSEKVMYHFRKIIIVTKTQIKGYV